jgi:hypothetical protein
LAELLARGEATRAHSQALLDQHHATMQRSQCTMRGTRAARDELRRTVERGMRSREARLAAAAAPTAALQYSAYHRLQARLETMPVIEQAKGIIMAQSGCSEAEAFDRLRKSSQRQNIPVRELARTLTLAVRRAGAEPQLDRSRTEAVVA